MSQNIVIGPVNQGLRTDRTAFVIDNDSFPTMINAYQWRGRIKRKRGTSLLGRLTRYFNSASASYSSTSTITLSGIGAGNLLTGFSLQTNGNIIPGSVNIANGGTHYTDPSMDGTLSPSGAINYATGAIVILAEANNSVTAIFRYYPDIPVMGLEDLNLVQGAFPGTLGFDQTYSYNIPTASPYSIYDVSFYKNPAASPPYNYTNYVPKTVVTPVNWNGQSYQQFWTVNYQGALWATNGITAPFTTTNIGMQYKAITVVDNITGGPPAKARLHIAAHGLTKGDFVFVNEVVTTTGINFQTGYVVSNDPQNAGFVDVQFPNATIATEGTGGIAQYLTRSADATKDCIRWYDGDPTNVSATAPTLTGGNGWVNFCPPISQSTLSVADLPAAQYYLVGARMIIPFKDRLLFLGPVVQTSTAGSQKYLQDTIIYSQNGTPYYTCSYTNTPSSTVDTPASVTNVFNPILVPVNQTATSPAFFADSAGFGGWIQAGFQLPIVTAAINQDVLVIGFSGLQTKLVYTGNDLVPFNFFVINAEFGSTSTFSSITMDRGVITVGNNGIVITSQVDSQRIDLQILDQLFQFNLTNNGPQRVCAQRDFINEWIYFTYLSNESSATFPNQTLQYNYRDNSWAIFNESYTTYGNFRKTIGNTWATIGTGPTPVAVTWNAWNEPWNSGETTLLSPEVIGGNQQGFVLIRGQGTEEGNSLYIQSISGSTITSPSHGLNNGDYIVINGCLGTIGTQLNGKIFSVFVPGGTTNTFTLNPAISSGTYLGGGTIQRMYVPFVQSKQFPTAWAYSRKTRLGMQQYLFTTTAQGQITLLIFLSQDGSSAYNSGALVPDPNTQNSSLVYSTIVYTCPESTNIGLTASNTNLQMPTASSQQQIWHRMNTSLIGDTVQLGITLSDTQMRDTNFNNQFVEIELHSIILTATPSQMLA